MEPSSRTARLAAVLYIVSGVPAVFSLQYIPAKFIVRGNPAATAGKVLASEALFRLVLWFLIKGVRRPAVAAAAS
jgi:hypothetical protein